MASLNRAASKAMIGAGASACTDITGFGLFGHLLRLARQAKLSARVFADTLPAFDGVLDALRAGVVPGAVERNREYVGAKLSVEPGVDEIFVHLGCDPQTSGGLLIAIAPSRLPTLLSAMAQAGVTGVAIGRFSTPSEAVIHLYRSAVDSTPSLSAPPVQRVAGDLIPISTMNATPEPTPHSADCCADVFPPTPSSPVSETQRAFGAFMRAVQAGGALDARTKELILFSLVVFSRCQPCFHSHHEKALQMGISQAELEEAAWCAIALGGSPVRMFYQESTARK
jgi:AhpD family alkylhydroperoxidase